MNHVFRLVWNPAVGVLQVASELAHATIRHAVSGDGSGPRRVRAWRWALTGTAVLTLSLVASPAWSGTCPAGAQVGASGEQGADGANGAMGSSEIHPDGKPGESGGQGGDAETGLAWSGPSSLTIHDGDAYCGGGGGSGGDGGDGGRGWYTSFGSGGDGGEGGVGGDGGWGGLGIEVENASLDNDGSILGGAGGAGGHGGTGGPDGIYFGSGHRGRDGGPGGVAGGDAGDGGDGVHVDDAHITNTGSISGGDGGKAGRGGAGRLGGNSADGTFHYDGGTGSSGGNGGDGGDGGAGIRPLLNHAFQLTNTGHVSGGRGGDGTIGGTGASGGTSVGGAHGDGGDGGSGGDAGDGGVGVTGSADTIMTNDGQIAGGDGGNGGWGSAGGSGSDSGGGGDGNGGNGGHGGTGADGVYGVGYTLTNGRQGQVYGGDGGEGGHSGAPGNGSNGDGDGGDGGSGGAGGDGVGGSDFTLVNKGTVSGGAGGIGREGTAGGHATSSPGEDGADGDAGSGGYGVVGLGDVTLVNAGTIRGGVSGDGEQAPAVLFNGGNTLILEKGYQFVGNVISLTGFRGEDTLTLGGDDDGTFDVSAIVDTLPTSYNGTPQYSGFRKFEKTGDGTWTLQGSNTTLTPWRIKRGTLRVSNDANLGATSGAITLDGGELLIADSDFRHSDHPIELGDAGGAFNIPYRFTVEDDLDGDGSVTKAGNGTLELTGDNRYTGSTIIRAGTLTVSKDANMGDGSLIFAGGTLQNTQSITTSRPVGMWGEGTFQTDADLTLKGAIDYSGKLVKTGPGTLTLSASNHYTGGTLVKEGTLAVHSAANLGINNDPRQGPVGLMGALEFDGGTLKNTQAFSLQRDVILTGGGTVQTDADLTISGPISGSGELVKSGSHKLTLSGTNTYTGGTVIQSGTLQADTESLQGPVANQARLVFNQSADGAFDAVITGSGSVVKQGDGTLVLNGTHTYTGDTRVDDGLLIIGDAQHASARVAGDVDVVSQAGLGGHGTVGGDVSIDSNGHLAPGGSIGALTVNGDLVAAQGAQFDFEFGRPGADFDTIGNGDRIHVGGNLTLDDVTVNVIDSGDFGPGLYRLIDYDGTLERLNGGLHLGHQPADTNLALQTLTADKQINLLNTSGMTLNIWNANGKAGSQKMGGGTGTWSNRKANWTDAENTVTLPMQPRPGFAIFGGDAGTVTVDNGDGAVAATGLQFASDGYALEGDELKLVAGSGSSIPSIRVGDGSADGARYTATITNVIAGSDGLQKTGAGTLILTAANTYAGGTTVRGGTLSVSGDDNLGQSSAGLTLDGGMLAVTGTTFHGTSRDITLGDAGGGFDITDSDHTFSVPQALHGDGGLTKRGAGTLVLTGANTYAGGTTISAGTLLGDTTSLQGDIDDNAALVFHQTDDGTFAGAISGSGTLTKTGKGTLTLTGTNRYAGGTTLSAGTLRGDTGSLQGDIDDHAALVFHQTDDGTFAGAISGSGTLTKTGKGTLTLTGTNRYAGGTTLSAGTLRGDTGSLQGDIDDHAALVFHQTDDGTFAGAISGSGTLTKTGKGTLVLTGTNSYRGGTSVDGGVLSVARDAGLGAPRGALTLDGGTLRVTGTAFTGTARDIILGGAGGGFDIADKSNTFRVGQALGGHGGLTKSGKGTLKLTGANTYRGGTTINAGTLAGNTRSLQGDITNHATLRFDQSDDGVFAGKVHGTGTLTKTGAGALVLDSVNRLSGDTVVQSGSLIVGDAGHAAATLGGMVTVTGKAVIGGYGTIGGLDLSGTLSPGHSIGTLHVSGDATFHKGSIYRIEAAPDGKSDQLDVAGKVSILGGSALALGQGKASRWAPQTTYTVLTADKGVSGRFADVSSSLVFLTPVLAYTDDAVQLTLQRNDIDLASVTRTLNQQAVAESSQSLGFSSPVYTALTLLDAAEARDAFDQLSGEIHADMQRARLDASDIVRRGMNQRLVDTLDGDAGGIWAQASGRWGAAGARGGAARLDTNSSALLVGADTVLSTSGLRLGALLGDTQASLSADDRHSTAHLRSTWVGIYAGGHRGAWRLRGGAAYAWTDTGSTRHIVVPGLDQTLESDNRNHAGQAFIEGGWRVTTRHGHVEPYVNLADIRIRSKDHRERGGSAALHVAGKRDNLSFGTIGVRGAWQWGTADRVAAWHGGVGLRHAFGSVDTMTTMRFMDADRSFVVAGQPVARNAALVNIGLRFDIGHRWHVDADYNGQFARHAKTQGASMQATWTF